MQHYPTIQRTPAVDALVKRIGAARLRQTKAVTKLKTQRFELADSKLRKVAAGGLRDFVAELFVRVREPERRPAARQLLRSLEPLESVFIEYRQYLRCRSTARQARTLRDALRDAAPDEKALCAALSRFANSQLKDARAVSMQTFVLRRVAAVLADGLDIRRHRRNLIAARVTASLLGTIRPKKGIASLVSHALTGTGLRRRYSKD